MRVNALVILPGEKLGDALCSLPALWEIADAVSGDVYFACNNPELQSIIELPPNVKDVFKEELPPIVADVFRLSYGKAIEWNHFMGTPHPTQQIIAYFGLPVPEQIPQPRIKVERQELASYDWLIAPLAADPSRSIPFEVFQELLKTLPGTKGVLHNKQFAYDSKTDTFSCFGYTLAQVVNLMRDAKRGVVTCESGISRLAHAAGIDHHVLLTHNLTPIEHQIHPKCIAVAWPWTAEGILDALSKRIGEPVT